MFILLQFVGLFLWCRVGKSYVSAQNINGFTLIKTPSTDLGPVPTSFDLGTVGRLLSIRAETTNNLFGRVEFYFDGKKTKVEYTAPYAIGGDTNGVYKSYSPLTELGIHSIEAKAFDSTGKCLETKSINVTVTNPTSPVAAPIRIQAPVPTPAYNNLAVEGFNLVVMSKGVTSKYTLPPIIDLATTGRSLSIEALTSTNAKVAKVSFSWDGDFVCVEEYSPWALNGNSGSAFNKFEPLTILGSHTLAVKAMDSSNVVLERKSINVTVVNSSPVTSPIPAPASSPTGISQTFQILGELRKWHKVTLAFTGPFASETDAINPFMQYRFDVTFNHTASGKSYKVPGYFAADGNAANSSASSGNKWHCHFAPDEIGNWTYVASFVEGTGISVSTSAGVPTSFHGQSGVFTIESSNKSGRDHRGKGRLMYVGQHHQQFAETGEWFLKAGADSPENFLAYDDFDNTPDNGGRRKSWAPHQQHFVTGDPTWKNGKGTGIIGVVNYLSLQGMNAFSFLTMNVNGDDKNVYPYISPTSRQRMDVSKLAQWEIVFEHADKMGMFLHFKTAETENDQLLDGGALGTERKLYYRELIARFGHHLALNWNLSEEITNTIAQIKQFSDYFKANDPYKHIVVTHTYPEDLNMYADLTGHPTFDGASLQTLPENVFQNTLRWVQASNTAGHKWIVTNDEQNPANTGVVPDSVDPNHDTIRQRVLWGNIMAGGAGVEYYFGYSYSDNDLLCENLASRQNMWTQSRYALEFFRNNDVPFHQMSNMPNRVNSATDWLLSSSDGTVHVVYRRSTPSGGSINMTGLPGTYTLKWYNPRVGGLLQDGSVTSIAGDTGSISYGRQPNLADTKDWVLLLRRV